MSHTYSGKPFNKGVFREGFEAAGILSSLLILKKQGSMKSTAARKWILTAIQETMESETSRREYSLANILIAALCDPEQSTK